MFRGHEGKKNIIRNEREKVKVSSEKRRRNKYYYPGKRKRGRSTGIIGEERE